jgi:hypothetical protein
MTDRQLGERTSLELFCGTKSFSKAAAELGFQTFTVDIDPQHDPDLCADVLALTVKELPPAFQRPRVVWASIPCTVFSICSQWKHWEKRGAVYYPRTEEAREGVKIARRTLDLLAELAPTYWFIENPRGMLRKMPFMAGLGKRRTVTYCRYGDTVRKPTDIWTNCYRWHPLPMCANGSSCHIQSPRKRNGQGSNRGIRDSKADPVERSVVPAALCEEIVKACEVGA